MRSSCLFAFAFISVADASAAQQPVEAITLGWAVDTSASPVRGIVRTVTAYYALPSPGRTPTTLWAADEQDRFPLYDLAAPQLYQPGFSATIVSVVPATPDSALYVVRTLFATADSSGRNIQPLGLQLLYARPAPSAPYGWQISGSLGVLTRDWTVRQVGGITYHIPPDRPFRRDLANAAASFLDSVATRLGVRSPGRLDYYVTTSWEASERLVGLDLGLANVAFSGRAFPAEGLVFSGHPDFGEAFTHELAHIVVGEIGQAEDRHRMIDEGVATWLGGGSRGPVDGYYALLRDFQRADSGATVAGLLQRYDAEVAFYATGALIAQAVHRRGGLPALRQLLALGPTDDAVLAGLPALLGIANDDLDAWWRTEALRSSANQ